MSERYIALIGAHEVTVQALRVNGSKMTLQFFRQIPRASYFIRDAEPDSTLTAWGRVIYLISKEGREWLLAQRDGNLYRCCIDLPSASEWAIEHHTKGIAEAKEKFSKYDGKPHFNALAQLAQDSLSGHTQELKISSDRIELAKRQVTALLTLQNLPQLYIA